MKKIIFFDIDGTLLDHSIGMDSPSPKTVEAIRKLKENDYYCVAASARSNLTEELSTLPFAGKILCNGAYIEFEEKELYNKTFSQEQLNDIISVINKFNGAYIMGGYKDILISETGNPLINVHEQIYGKTESKEKAPDVEKINGVTALFHTKADMYTAMEKLPAEWSYHIYETPNVHVDIYLSGFSKGGAVKYLYEYLNIAYENTYAFGDGQNDKEMMELVKYSTAMGNAVSEIKDIAYMTTENVNNEGIYKALKIYELI